ncbi:hypothetical protein PHLCEN_2v2421 [Hermanssonia centrifuga]|uniref:Large ribosomal subunit protein mL54 n=1 Tax=Hermanssonia centrifuga TaxID=98765 RepID=A0A2R6RM67_9APHY|nr:hypothetical protein PHLCEN_2v2421 [Hermanssonia centrifuga]
MSFLQALRRPRLSNACWRIRTLHSSQSRFTPSAGDAVKKGEASPVEAETSAPQTLSSCVAGTPLEGVNWLKNQAPVQALPDEDYPPWLWKVLEPREFDDPEKAEKYRLRQINRKHIREKNYMSTQ